MFFNYRQASTGGCLAVLPYAESLKMILLFLPFPYAVILALSQYSSRFSQLCIKIVGRNVFQRATFDFLNLSTFQSLYFIYLSKHSTSKLKLFALFLNCSKSRNSYSLTLNLKNNIICAKRFNLFFSLLTQMDRNFKKHKKVKTETFALQPGLHAFS